MEFNDRLPIYRQVADYFREKMATGEYQAGSELPSRRQVASVFRVNPNTVQRAYSLLESEGLIETHKTMASRVTEKEDRLQALREELLGRAIASFVDKIAPFDMERSTVMDLLNQALDEKEAEDHD
ncbi:GntR family transcriptional regulator [Aerococcus urinae]|uniref:GntR family transcriptional regulator n=1 Tax=Aerococcus urinae TaxID=1376 RepID=UPI00227B771B|nr:GntR family transcriptional regulator [Aerococcus urinae]MCY3037224.1 GntR family transcriptional regulator [Aerococcus urinae]